jgi:hypothetical protein
MRNSRSASSTNDHGDIGSAPLILDVVGPFVIQFRRGHGQGTAIIMAPPCRDHHANLLTDRDDISVAGGGSVYKFRRGHAPTGAKWYAPPRTNDIFRVLFDSAAGTRDGERNGFHRKCHATFNVPMPNRIVALRPEVSFVYRNNTKVWVMDRDDKPTNNGAFDPDHVVNSRRGRGVRFVYDRCDAPPDFDLGEEESAGLDAKTRGFPLLDEKFPFYYSITISFRALHLADDGADDAHECFQTMRAMFDPPRGICEFSQWRADFADPPANTLQLEHLGGDRPHDCGSVVMVMQDWSDADFEREESQASAGE